MRVREARPRDALEWIELHRVVVAEERWFIRQDGEVAPNVEDLVHQIDRFRGSSEGTLLVARQDRRLAGFLSLRAPPFRITQHVVKLEIAVREEARGCGVGRALMDAGVCWARAQTGISKIGLAVFVDNVRAVELYKAYGFQQEGCRVREYRRADGSYRDDLLLFLEV